jgi:hypothetical protein
MYLPAQHPDRWAEIRRRLPGSTCITTDKQKFNRTECHSHSHI